MAKGSPACNESQCRRFLNEWIGLLVLQCGVVFYDHGCLWVMLFLNKVILHMGIYLMWFLEMVVKLVAGQTMNHCRTVWATPECGTSFKFDAVLWNWRLHNRYWEGVINIEWIIVLSIFHLQCNYDANWGPTFNSCNWLNWSSLCYLWSDEHALRLSMPCLSICSIIQINQNPIPVWVTDHRCGHPRNRVILLKIVISHGGQEDVQPLALLSTHAHCVHGIYRMLG